MTSWSFRLTKESPCTLTVVHHAVSLLVSWAYTDTRVSKALLHQKNFKLWLQQLVLLAQEVIPRIVKDKLTTWLGIHRHLLVLRFCSVWLHTVLRWCRCQNRPFSNYQLPLYGGPALSACFSCVTNQNPSPSYSFRIKSLLESQFHSSFWLHFHFQSQFEFEY